MDSLDPWRDSLNKASNIMPICLTAIGRLILVLSLAASA